ncbi:MAG TPA: proline dehydrogenase family protein [Bacteroidia bacterium]|jgi:proline dehydrogenase|nr:proline dehydrogenase family protein [Bacteroidia bacterium]
MEASPKISFDNLENAFASKTNGEIEQAYWLFKAIGNPTLVKTGSSVAEWALRNHLPVKGMIKGTIFKQFCGGENIQECTLTINKLGKYGVGSILDYSVEGKEEEKDLDRACEEIIATVKRAKGDNNIPFSVFKVTGLARHYILEKVSAGEELSEADKAEFDRVSRRVQRICEEGHKQNVRVFIDAEESWIQKAIDELATVNMERYNKERAIIYNTFQMYRHDRLSFLKVSYEKATQGNYFLGLKLVRGAYMEKERERAAELGYASPIQPDKESTDRDYNEALRFCVDHFEKISICAGTHNEESSMILTELMASKGIAKGDERIYYSQLLGMSDHISFNLAKEGYKVAKYVPYGPVEAVLPYLTRRAQENTSMAGQMGRELSLILAEKKRRKG